jgi:hypothetical protein
MQFTKEQFIEIFVKYNTSVFPVQIFLYILGLIAVYLAFKKSANSDKLICIILTLFWLWIGIVYNFIFFSTINKAAYIFGSLYIIQSGLFFYTGVIKSRLKFNFHPDKYTITGAVLIAYGLLIYPLLGMVLGHIYPAQPTFGLPCPTTIFTFDMLLWSANKASKYLLIIPGVWSVIGFFAALNFGIYEDIGLLVSGVTGVILFIMKEKKLTEAAEH